MNMTNDQYVGLSQLRKWYRKYNHQFIEISGIIGTGTWDLVQKFIDVEGLDMKEIMYLSYDQKQVLELAYKRYHAYYINSIIYNYIRIVDFDTLPVVNPYSNGVIEYEWKKDVKKKIDERYKLIVVFDSILMGFDTIRDLGSFGIPVILIRDPMLIPAPDTYTFLRDANIELREPHPEYLKNPLVYFAHKILYNEKLLPGSYDNVSVVPRKQMNLYNLKSSEMTITMSDELRNTVNKLYREKILKQKSIINVPNEKVIVSNNMYGHRLVNKDEKKVKVFLTKGIVGYINRINKHALYTRYVPIEFRPEFYHESFTDLVLDRHYLNHVTAPCKQIIPDEITKMEYAYALTPQLARFSHWNKVTMIADYREDADEELMQMLMYTGITRCKRFLTLII